MKTLLRPFEELVTNWKSDQFFRARLKLSLLYVAVSAVIILVLTTFFFMNTHRQIKRFPVYFPTHEVFHNDSLPCGPARFEGQQEFLQCVESEVIYQVIETDIIILLIMFFISYQFAGYTLRPLKKSMEQQRRFIGDASHEFRTPLAVMKTSIGVFERYTSHQSKEVKELLETMNEEVDRLANISTQLLDLAKSDTTGISSVKPIDMSALCERLEARFKSVASTRNIALSFTAVPRVLVSGDQHSLEGAFSNIIENALKYTESGGRVTVEVEKKNKTVVISVYDTGIGIAEKDIPKIFERFYQSDTSKSTEGAGLGLAIVKSVIAKHEGTIEVESALGKGSTFKVILPAISS